MCTAPCIHNATDPMMQNLVVNGLATIPGRGGNGRDALALATSNGLYAWTIQTPTDTLTPTAMDPVGNWQSVCVGDLDGVAPEDFVGVSGNGTDKIRICLRNAQTTVVTEMQFAGQTVAKVVLAQWNDVGPVEICVATNQRLWIGSPTGVIRQVTLNNSGGSNLLRVRGNGRDNLAWLVNPGQQELRTFSPTTQCIAVATSLGSVAHWSAGDWDDNGTDDLLISAPGAVTAMKLVTSTWVSGASGGVSFAVGSATSMTPFTNPQPALLVWGGNWMGDLNADGYVDVFAVSRVTNTSNVSTSTAWTHRRVLDVPVRPLLDPVKIKPVGANTEFQFKTAALNPPTGATHLELLIWEGTGLTGSLQTKPDGVGRVRSPAAVVWPEFPSVTFTADAAAATRAYTGALRWIQVSGTTTTKVWQPTRFAMTFSGNVLAYQNWLAPRLVEASLPPGLVYSPTLPNGILLAPIIFTETYYSFSGDQEPPDLPPPPPVPVKPPTPEG